jgi:hypothetical protein
LKRRNEAAKEVGEGRSLVAGVGLGQGSRRGRKIAGLGVVVLGLERREELRLAARVAGRERDGEEVLGLGDGAGGAELDDVADLELVVGVVGLVLLLDALAALVLGVRRQAHHLHTHRLVRLGRHHPPTQLLRRLDAKLRGDEGGARAQQRQHHHPCVFRLGREGIR